MASWRLGSYCVVWRRVGDLDAFRHDVTAANLDEARDLSLAAVRRALGPNLNLWRLESIAPSTDDVGPGLRFIRRILNKFTRHFGPAPPQRVRVGR